MKIYGEATRQFHCGNYSTSGGINSKRRSRKAAFYNLKDSIKLLKDILMLNNINPNEFVINVLSVMEKKHPKKNCLYLQGESNSMKSTIARSIMGMVPIAGQQMQSREFGYPECVNANVIWAEECYTTQDIINDIKRIWEGSETMINVKNKNGINLVRTPVIACGNYEPRKYVPDEKSTLLNRCFHYKFSKKEAFKDRGLDITPLVWEYFKNKLVRTRKTITT